MDTMESFNICPKCLTRWRTKGDFLSDSAVVFIGYQADLANPGSGLLLFTHSVPGCLTTTAVFVHQLFDP